MGVNSLEVAEDKTNIIEFSRCKIRSRTSFNFLGFDNVGGLNCRNKKRLRQLIMME